MRHDPKNEQAPRKMIRSATQPARCGAKKRDGSPCRKWPLAGSRRCRLHGSASPASQAKARERILGAADLAAQRLIEFMNDKRVPWSVRLTAARDLLDRGGLAHRPGIDITVEPPWQALIEEIVMDVPDGWESPTPAFERDEDFKEPAIESGEIVDAEIIEEPAATPTPAPPSPTVGSGSLVPPQHIRERLPEAARSNVEWRR